MSRRPLIDARRQKLAFRGLSRGQYEAAVAVTALDLSAVAHLEIDARMAQGAADAVAGDAAGAHDDHFGVGEGGGPAAIVI